MELLFTYWKKKNSSSSLGCTKHLPPLAGPHWKGLERASPRRLRLLKQVAELSDSALSHASWLSAVSAFRGGLHFSFQ